ncbi:nucleotidyltransferase family protein [Plebeiibacterium marinum]|uniref:Nucleotidyltransferase family protein n=1 Tax=Plebeiibacterium marinum TaxID=2992111 RepID=A0AAE3SJK0_9BACT|nr:nucleotidyltransferase family protein [Plebeiobacterium marinum]MCW3805807.1 nucleotidyltransferase family protein [Plebeiobacterium marinum]
MKDFQKYIINQGDNILKAFELLNNVPEALTLFVVKDNNKMVGTLTDGDIRRAFLKGKSTNDKVCDFMKSSFHALHQDINPIQINEIKKLGIHLLPILNNDGCIRKVIDLNKKQTVLPIDAVIMAGGKGERLRPLTNNTPKPMLPLGNKPIIEHNIDRLISYGIENIYISVNYLADQIKDYFGDGSSKGINIKYLEEEQFLGTIGSVSMVSEFANPYVLVMNSDLFTDVDLEDLWINMVEEKANLSVASISYTVNIPFAIMTREGGRITGLKEKPSNTHYANAGIYLMKTKECYRIPKDSFYNATDLIENIIETGGKVIDNPITGYWIDIGRHEEYNKAQEIIKHLKQNF